MNSENTGRAALQGPALRLPPPTPRARIDRTPLSAGVHTNTREARLRTASSSTPARATGSARTIAPRGPPRLSFRRRAAVFRLFRLRLRRRPSGIRLRPPRLRAQRAREQRDRADVERARRFPPSRTSSVRPDSPRRRSAMPAATADAALKKVAAEKSCTRYLRSMRAVHLCDSPALERREQQRVRDAAQNAADEQDGEARPPRRRARSRNHAVQHHQLPVTVLIAERGDVGAERRARNAEHEDVPDVRHLEPVLAVQRVEVGARDPVAERAEHVHRVVPPPQPLERDVVSAPCFTAPRRAANACNTTDPAHHHQRHQLEPGRVRRDVGARARPGNLLKEVATRRHVAARGSRTRRNDEGVSSTPRRTRQASHSSRGAESTPPTRTPARAEMRTSD